MNTCKNCATELKGRVDKKFCNSYCKSAYHYEANKNKKDSLFLDIDKQLKTNRRLLKSYNKSGYASINVDTLNAEGFNPNYFTHYWKNSKGDVYLFCYEYGFLKREINQKKKYILIIWQTHMEKKK